MKPSGRWTELLLASSLAEAEMWRELLETEGIIALVRPGEASIYLGPNTMTRVLVPDSARERAEELLAAWNQPMDGENDASAAAESL